MVNNLASQLFLNNPILLLLTNPYHQILLKKDLDKNNYHLLEANLEDEPLSLSCLQKIIEQAIKLPILSIEQKLIANHPIIVAYIQAPCMPNINPEATASSLVWFVPHLLEKVTVDIVALQIVRQFWRMNPLIVNKLIRDKMSACIAQKGRRPQTRALNDNEFKEALEKKLQEEIQEYCNDQTPEELVDLLEIIYTIATLKGINKEALDELRRQKREQYGGFDTRTYLEKVELL